IATRLEADFVACLDKRDIAGAAGAVLELDDALEAWSADTLQSDEPARVRATLRSMVVRLGQAAAAASGRAGLIGPLIDELLAARAAARRAGRYADADAVRDRLAGLGIEIRDSEEGSSWHLES
nr:hypothetical protein [Actinomycetota bacterium]